MILIAGERLLKGWMNDAQHLEELIAILPEYLTGRGDVTACVFEKGIRYDDRTIRSVTEDLMLTFGSTRRIINRQYGELIGRQRNVPLPLNVHLLLVPFKARKTHIKKDSVNGFAMLHRIESIHAVKGKTNECEMSVGGHRIQVYQSLKSLQQSIRTAHLVSHLVWSQQQVGAGNSFRYFPANESFATGTLLSGPQLSRTTYRP